MATIKKYNGSTWVDAPLRKMGTATDTITPPTTIYADGTAATLSLKGNTVQNGTPTPTNPVAVVGVGELENLMINVETFSNTTIDPSDDWYRYGGDGITSRIECEPTTKYYLQIPDSYTRLVRIYCTDSTSLPTTTVIPVTRIVREDAATTLNYEFTTTATAKYIVLQFSAPQTGSVLANSTLSRGYKIPILNGGVTTNVYLGEVQTIRKNKKIVLNGTENWSTLWGAFSLDTGEQNIDLSTRTTIKCSHLVGKPNLARSQGFPASYGDNVICFRNAGANLLIKCTTYPDIESFKSFLRTAFESGNAVTIWCVLETPELLTINEPLQSVRVQWDNSAADEVLFTVSTTDGANVLSIGTTVQPSEVSATYHGWHEGTVKDYENGDWQPQAQALSLNSPMLSNGLMAVSELDEPIAEPEMTE